MPIRPIVVATLFLLAAGCGKGTTAGAGRSQHELDSMIGESKVPNHGAVKSAVGVAQESRDRMAREDSIATGP